MDSMILQLKDMNNNIYNNTLVIIKQIAGKKNPEASSDVEDAPVLIISSAALSKLVKYVLSRLNIAYVS